MLLTRLPFLRKLLNWRLFVVFYVLSWVALLVFTWLEWSTLPMISRAALTALLVLTTPAIDDVARMLSRGSSSGEH